MRPGTTDAGDSVSLACPTTAGAASTAAAPSTPSTTATFVAASEVQAWFDLDEVVFVPTGEPWQKAHRE